MADDQQQEQIQRPSVSSEQSATNSDMVQSVRELMHKDKSTVLVKAIELLVLNLQQQQVIMMLKQTLQKAIDQNQQMLKDLHDQPVMESLMSNIEAQNHSTRKQLGDKVESINMHMKSNEVLRKQLKKEISGFRSGIEDAKRQIQEKEEIGKILHQAHVEIMDRIEEVGKQLRSVSSERAKLHEEHIEKMEKLKRMRSSYEGTIKGMQAELMEWENVLQQRVEELAIIKQQITENDNAYRQMQLEKHDFENLSDELKQKLQTEKIKLEESFAAEKNQIDQLYFNKADEYKNKIEELNQTLDSLTNTKEQLSECIAELDVAISRMVEEINDVQNQNVKLENELAIVRSTINLDTESEMSMTQQPINNVFTGRPRAQFFIKSGPVETNPPPCSTENDDDESCHLDNMESSVSMNYSNRK